LESIFENILKAGGIDIFSGIDFWRKYREFLVDEHEEFMDKIQESLTVENDEEHKVAAMKMLKSSKQKFIKIFHRQFSIPLVGNDTTVEELENLLGEYCIESDVDIIQPQSLQTKLLQSEKLKEGRLTYELFLHSDEYYAITDPAERWKAWKTYIQYEKNEKEMIRAQRLYERAVIACCLPPHPDNLPSLTIVRETIWLEYTEFVLCQLKHVSSAQLVIERAIKQCPTSLWLRKCQLYTLTAHFFNEYASNFSSLVAFAEKYQAEDSVVVGDGEGNVFVSIQKAYQTTMQTGFPQSIDYLEYQITYCNLYRRLLMQLFSSNSDGGNGKVETSLIISLQSSDPKFQEKQKVLVVLGNELTKSLQQYETLLKSYYAEYAMGWYEYMKYFHRIYFTMTMPLQSWLDRSKADDLPGPSTNTNANANKKQAQTQHKAHTSKVYKMWEEAISINDRVQQQQSYWLWKEMISSFLQQGELDIVRSIYKKLMAHFTFVDMTKEQLVQEYIHFEEEWGVDLVTSIYPMLSKILPSVIEHVSAATLQSVVSTESAAMVIETTEAVQSIPTTSNKTSSGSGKRSRSSNENNDFSHTKQSNLSTRAIEGNSESNESVKKKRKVVFQDDSQPEPEPAVIIPVVQPTIAGATPEVPANNVQDRTYFVKNIPFHVSSDAFTAMLKEIIPTDIESVEFIKSKSGAFRGIVKVILSKADQQSLLALNEKEYEGRKLLVSELKDEKDPSLVKASEDATGGNATDQKVTTTTIFINHLVPEVTDEDLKKLFESCGEIVAAKVARDKRSHISKVSNPLSFNSFFVFLIHDALI
jgi:RNA recognition motif-containing protein